MSANREYTAEQAQSARNIIAMFAILECKTGPEGSWSLERNDHRGYYGTATDMIESRDMEDAFESPGECQKAKDQNSIAVLQWYEDNPVGFILVASHSLEALAEYFVRSRMVVR